MLLAFLALSLTASCSAPSGDGCAWVAAIQPDRADVLTDGTKRQIVAHNRAVERFCR